MMESKEEFTSTQKSVSYYIDPYREKDPIFASSFNYLDNIYTHRLINEVSLGIMPIGGRTKRNDFKVIIVPEDKRIQNLIIKGIAHDYYRGDLAEEICHFFEHCVQSILAYGEANYEIAYLSKKSDNQFAEFKFVTIPPFSLILDGKNFYQYLPKDLAEQNKLPQYIQLSNRDVLRFQAPEKILNDIKTVLSSLAELSKNPTLPDFVLENMNNNFVPPFDMASFQYSENLALVDAGKKIGWNPFTPNDNILEYYWFHRFLYFEQFKIDLRDSILLTFNEGLNIIGQKLGFSVRLEIKGLPTNEDVNTAQSKLLAGNITFNKLLDHFSLL